MYALQELEEFCESFPFFNKYPDYNNFFYPNICHYCKKKDDGNFVPCNKCNMIVYCNLNHRLRHYACHVQICDAMQKLLESHPQFRINFELNFEKWAETRKEFLRLISLQLQRDLKPYEVQMITLTRSCFVCHEQANYICMKCYSVNYCCNHIDRRKLHSCEELRLCFQIDFELGFYSDSKMKFVNFPDKDNPVVNMNTFIEQYVCPRQYINGILSRNVLSYFYADYVSGPLTLYYGMRDTDLLDTPPSCYVIHIIAANFVDREYLAAWELLLHLLPEIELLKIILTGPGLCTEYKYMKICLERCRKQHKSLNFETHRMLYHDYANSDKYTRPNLIIGFQTNLNDWEKLQDSISKIQNQNCPLLLTAKSKFQADQNVNKIKEVLGSYSNLVYHNENMFSSYRPYRDFENGDVSYRNKYLSIYKQL